MLELGQNTAAGGSNNVFDATDATFMSDVVEQSQKVPVIVDFWGPVVWSVQDTWSTA